MLRCAVYLTTISNISLPASPHAAFVLVQNKNLFLAELAPHEGTSGSAPGMLYSTPCMSECGGPAGGSHSCHHRRWMGSSKLTSSLTVNRLPVGFTVPQSAARSIQTHSVDSQLSNLLYLNQVYEANILHNFDVNKLVQCFIFCLLPEL